MDYRRAALAGLIASLSACVADTGGLLTPGSDGGTQARPDATTPSPDGGPGPDATSPDATSPDATSCAPGRTALTISGGAFDLDLAPSGDRFMAYDGNQLTVYDLATGIPVQQANGVTGALSRDGRTLVFDRGNGELLTQDEQGNMTRVSSGFACDHQLTPSRRYVIASVDCRDVPGGSLVGRLEITDLEARTTFSDEEVLVRSLRATRDRGGVSRLAYQRRPQGTSCSRCPTSDAEVVETTLEAAGDAAPPDPVRRFVELLGYGPDGATLVARSGICGCAPDDALTSVLFLSGRALAEGIVRSFVFPEPLDTHGVSAFAQSPSALGRAGLLNHPRAPRSDLSYLPYDPAQPAQTLLVATDVSGGVVLTSAGRDSAVLTTDAAGRLLRIPLSSPQIVAEVLSPPGSFGVPSLIVSEDRDHLAFVADTGGQVVISELFIGPATGPVSLVHSSGEPIHLRGFVPGGRGVLAVMDGGALRLFRGETALDIDRNVDPTGPLVTDARGCWVAHRRAGAAAELRVVPLP